MAIVHFIISLLVVVYFRFEIPDLNPYSQIGIFIFSFFTVHFFTAIGSSIPIRSLMVLISTLQWIIGPFLSYHYFTESGNYYMIIPEEEYMSYVVLAELAFIAGIYLFSLGELRKITFAFEQLTLQNRKILYSRGMFLVVLGVVATIIQPMMPGSLAFFMLLIAFTKYIGAFYIFLSKEPLRWLWILLAFSFEILHAFGSAMFHELILWMLFLYLIYAFISKITTIPKLISMISIISAVFTIQYIKTDYREVVWENKISDDVGKLAFAGELAQKKLSTDSEIEKQDKLQEMVDRINQGWIIARIMYVVPQYEPFAEGETIQNGIFAALVPRIFVPNKATTGGQLYFERFTGMELIGNTSMDLSIVGEAYANYGVAGGIFFMFLLGLFYNLTLKYLTKKAQKNPELLLWIPLIYFYTVKAESDFTTSVNHLTKSSLLLILLMTLLSKIIPNKLNSSTSYQKNTYSSV